MAGENVEMPCAIVLHGTETEEEKDENKRLAEVSQRFSYRIPQQVIFRGILLNEVVNPEGMQALSKLQLKHDDVVICGYPKSGTTWISGMLSLILSAGEKRAVASGLRANGTKKHMVWLDDREEHDKMADSGSPRLLKTHVPVGLMPPSAFTHGSRIVLALRNPKDVAVSYFYFHQLCEDFGEDFRVEFSEFAAMFRAGYVHWGDWTRHIQDWWRRSQTHPANIIPVFYEETKLDPGQAVRNLAQFLQVEVSDAEVEQVVDLCSFDSMKARAKNSYSFHFRRKGQVADWKNHFSQQESRLFDEWISENIKDEDLRRRFKFEL